MSDNHTLPTIIVPCYNEEHRLEETAFLDLAKSGRLRLLFIDDGSTDRTGAVLHRLAAESEEIDTLTLPHNVGKSEAVRAGLIEATERGAAVIGYYDADLATPPHELLRLLTIIESQNGLGAVFGARVAMLGSAIERTHLRHYLGRVYATAASMALGVDVYDTQCGAKVFRVNPTLLAAIGQPFNSQWAFDVELLGRLLKGSATTPGIPIDAFLEVPLNSWRDVEGTHVRAIDGLAAVMQLVSIGLHQRKSTD
jgi:glycosyltransferase involved in cell wall biosynthesis